MMKHLEEHISESVARKKTGKYGVDPETVRKGDRLRIKSDLSGYPVDFPYGPVVAGCTIYKSMRCNLGKVVTVTQIEKTKGKRCESEALVKVAENVFVWPIEIFEYL